MSYTSDLLRERLAAPREKGPSQVELHEPSRVAVQTAERLGHQMEPMFGAVAVAVYYCAFCDDRLEIRGKAEFGRERVTGPAATLRCKPKRRMPAGFMNGWAR